jgi:hypothetical protein
MRFVVGQNEAVARWVADRIPLVQGRGFGACSAVGIVSADGTPLAGVVFHDHQPGFGTIQFSIAAESPRWANRWAVKHLLAYPFDELGAQKVWSATPNKLERVLRLVSLFGFTREGTLGRHFGPYGHAIINRMYVEDYRRIYGDKPVTATAA